MSRRAIDPTRYARPGGFKSWEDLFIEYHKGLAQHLGLPRYGRGTYQTVFCEKYGIARYELNRLQKSYRVAYLENGAHTKEARDLFKEFEAGKFGPDTLRMKIAYLESQNGASDPEQYRSAMNQVGHHLDQIQLILEKLEKYIPEQISDEEVATLAKKIWTGRQKLSGWYNRKIREGRPQVLKGWEGKRP
jgi:hypothetical protein